MGEAVVAQASWPSDITAQALGDDAADLRSFAHSSTGMIAPRNDADRRAKGVHILTFYTVNA